MTEPKFRSDAHTQRKLYDTLSRSGDVSFVDLYLAAGGDPARQDEIDDKGRHYAQSWIGKYISRLNRVLAQQHAGKRVVKGRLRRTYCLSTVDE